MLVRRTKRKSDEEWLYAYADLITNLLIFFVAMLSVSSIDQVKMQKVAEQLSGQREEYSLASIKENLEQTIKSENLEKVVRVTLDDDGLRISINSGVVFAVGSEEIPKKYQDIFATVMNSVMPYVNRYEFAIEGHADNQKVKSGGRFPSNWELSTARANSIRKSLEKLGIEDKKLRVEGYGSSRPLPNDPKLTPQEQQALNRRVVIRVF